MRITTRTCRSTLARRDGRHLQRPTYRRWTSPTGRCARTRALPTDRAADDRPRPARGDSRGRHPGARRPRRRERRRHLRPAEPSGRRSTARRCSAASAGRPAQPTIRDQTAAAFCGDIGLSTMLADAAGRLHRSRAALPGAPPERPAARRRGRADEVRPRRLLRRNLAVPVRRRVDAPDVLRGKQVFYQSGCPACHTPKFVTPRRSGTARAELPADLALHRPPAARHGRGPRRRPPRGPRHRQRMADPAALGHRLHGRSAATRGFLHDGRARTLLEAILWHGGEAQAAKQRVVR